MSDYSDALADIERQLASVGPVALKAITEAAVDAIHSEIESDPKASLRMKDALHDVVGYRFETKIPQAGSRWVNGTLTAVVGLGVGPGYYARRRVARSRGDRKGGVGISGANIHWAALGTNDRYTGQRKTRGKIKETGNRRRYSGAMSGIKAVNRAESKLASIIDRIAAEVEAKLA